MKKIFALLLVFLPLFIFAQIGENESSDDADFQFGGSVGATTINGETYTRIRLNPELSIWKFGIGLDFDFLITAEGKIRKEDWDEWQDYINKILYLRFAHRGDPFYALVGSFPSYTLANGLIINGYTNMLNYPDTKKLGGYMGFNTDYSGFGMEMFAADFREFDVFAVRPHLKPFNISNVPLLEELVLGVSFAHDRNQFNRFEDSDGDGVPDIFDDFPNDGNYAVDTDGDGYPDEIDIDANGNNILDTEEPEGSVILADRPSNIGEKSVTIMGADYLLPIVDSEYFTFYHYGEYAKIINYGQGFIFPGFGSKFAIFDLRLEGRRFEDEFIPGFFDFLYDDQRAFVSGTEIKAKTSLLRNVKASTGWYGSATASIGNILYFDLAYQDMYGKNVTTGKSLWAGLRANTSMIPKINEAAIYYSQTNKHHIDFANFRNQSATVSGKISYDLSGGTYLVGNYQERYSDINGDGKIKGDDEIAKTFSFSVEFKF